MARHRRRPFAVRLARQAAQIEPGALQRLRDRAALIACHSGDENRSIACHGCFLRSLMMGSCLFPTVVYMKQHLSKIQSMKT